MKKTIITLAAAAALGLCLAGCAKNADTCAGGGEACKTKEAAGGKCCGQCKGDGAKCADKK